MDLKTFCFVATVVLFSVIRVNSEETTTTTNSTIPKAVGDAWQKFITDLDKMKHDGSFDDVKMLANIKDVSVAVLESVPTLEDKVKQIQTSITDANASGTPEPSKVKNVIRSIFELVDGQYPDAKDKFKMSKDANCSH